MANDVRVEVRCQWCYGDGEETVVLGEAAFKRPCHRCDGKKSVTAWLVGRDALVYLLGLADLENSRANEHHRAVDQALCKRQGVPFAPEPTPQLREAERLLVESIDKLTERRAALRAWDAAATHRGCTGPTQPLEER